MLKVKIWLEHMIPTPQDTGEGTGLFPGTSTSDRDFTRHRRKTEEAFQGAGGEPGRGPNAFKDGAKCVTCSGTFRLECGSKCLKSGFLTKKTSQTLICSICRFPWCKYSHHGRVQAADVRSTFDSVTSSSHELVSSQFQQATRQVICRCLSTGDVGEERRLDRWIETWLGGVWSATCRV